MAWQKIELAKRRLFYSLLQLGLPLRTRGEDQAAGLAFDFLADLSDSGDQARIMTGHDDGLITLAVAEANNAERERRQVEMAEPYRTLLGQFPPRNRTLLPRPAGA